MPANPRVILPAAILLIGGALLALTARGCRMQNLTPEALATARARWEQNRVPDYDLTMRLGDLRLAVAVRDSRVTQLKGIDSNVHVGQVDDYSIDGLFDVLELELDALSNPHAPFGAGAGSVLMRVRFHDQYGFPAHYLRSAGGPSRTHEFEVLSFTPRPPAAAKP